MQLSWHYRSLKILIKTFRCKNSFRNQKKKTDHEELGMHLLKNALAMQYITCLLPTQHLKRCSSGTPTAVISSHVSLQLL